jgi:signal transduction histidine kinase/integral membrane sensor domain MASE1
MLARRRAILPAGWSRRTLAGMALVFAGYYVGSHLGLILRIPPSTPSVLWPPNAILTAALLLAPPRRWWVYLLSALPAHLLAQSGAPWPTSMTVALYLTNCSEALIGAVAVRRLSDAPARFDTSRRVVALLVGAAAVGPFLSSFLDAAVVAVFRRETYWGVWATRFPSNVLTELALVPAILTLVQVGPAWLRTTSRARRAEAALFAAALISVAIPVMTASPQGTGLESYAHRAPFPFLLPLLAWAVVRFGPGGTSLSLLTTTLVAIWAAAHRLGVFGALPAWQSVLALQVILTITAAPVLCLAALLEERKATEAALARRLRFEEMLSRLSRAFVQPSSHEMSAAIQTWLDRLGRFFGLDQVVLLEPNPERDRFTVAYAWTEPGAVPFALPPGSGQGWLTGPLLSGQERSFASLEGVGGEKGLGRASLAASGVESAVILPLLAGGRVLGALAFLDASPRPWTPELLSQLRMVTEVLANALARKQSEDALRASETIKGAILSSLTSHVAVLDRRGHVIAVNDSWMLTVLQHDPTWTRDLESVGDYLALCRRSSQPADRDDIAGIEGVLDGSRPGYTSEHATRTSLGERWYTVSVVPLNRPEGGAVVSHTDITERRRAEIEAQQSREELAHFLRVSTVGELTTSIAHELNQPLTAILANAQTARHLLTAANPDLEELRAIVTDLIDEDKRAGEVIRRLRELLKKGQRESAALDLNALAENVARMVSSDALIRGVDVRLELDVESLIVRADRVQIQQVLLNLILNAMEAMEDTRGERLLVLRSRHGASGLAEVEVTDTGTGIPERLHDAIFQPFYTTKTAGMGMGLSIARSIADAHGGRLWASNNVTGGATLHLTLPLSAEEIAHPPRHA